MKINNYPIIVIKDENWYYWECPLFEWCYSQWNSLEELENNLKEVIKMCIEEQKEENKQLNLKKVMFSYINM